MKQVPGGTAARLVSNVASKAGFNNLVLWSAIAGGLGEGLKGKRQYLDRNRD